MWHSILSWARNAGPATGVGVVSATVAPTVATAALSAAGFTSAGIAAGSTAAGVQAGMGGVIAAGSWFAAAQSTAALGGFAILGPVGIGAGVVGSAAWYMLRR